MQYPDHWRIENCEPPNAVRLLAENPELHQELDQYDFNVTFTGGAKIEADVAISSIREFDGADKPVHLYFHMPLCSYICHYCSFVKRLIPHGQEKEALTQWAAMLTEESTRYLREFPWIRTAQVESIYLGGGTFALLFDVHEALESLFTHIRSSYHLVDDCEITIEGNPENYTPEHVEFARSLGVNRFSVGVQSLQDEVNEFARRGHSADQALEAVSVLRNTGLPFNADMIYGQPRQTPESFSQDIATLASFSVPTITTYRLRNRDRVPLATGNTAVWQAATVRERLEKAHAFPELQDVYRMRTNAARVLLGNGYRPGPACWWSLPGYYPYGIPRVSYNKWARYDTMISYGPGTYSWFSGGNPEIIQLHNIGEIGQYAKHIRDETSVPISFGRRITGVQAVSTVLGFNFKAFRPIARDRYLQQFGTDIFSAFPYAEVLGTLTDKGFLEKSPGGRELLPTLAGEMLHEEIMSVYFHGRLGASPQT
jgi:oxygen-independent coproporphyrinogen-3 oxidase